MLPITSRMLCTIQVPKENLTVSQHAHYQDRETEGAKWKLALINFMIFSCIVKLIQINRHANMAATKGDDVR